MSNPYNKNSLTFLINVQNVAEELARTQEEIKDSVNVAVNKLAIASYDEAVRLAHERLRSLKPIFLEHLHFYEVTWGLWLIVLDKKARWIDEGMGPYSMVPHLLKRGYKVAKDGSRYRAIPIGKKMLEKGTLDPRAQHILPLVRKELRKRGIPFRKIEKDKYGNPLLGVLHRIDLQAGKPSPRASHDLLAGLTIVQVKNPQGKVERHLLTFRTVSSKHEGWKWQHPGLKGANIFDAVWEFALRKWEMDILPELYRRFGKG